MTGLSHALGVTVPGGGASSSRRGASARMLDLHRLPNRIASSPQHPTAQHRHPARQPFLAATNAQADPQHAEAARLLAHDELHAHYESLTAEPTFTREP